MGWGARIQACEPWVRASRCADLAYDGSMTTDFSGSDEMIRQAKESLRLEKEDFLPRAGENLGQAGISDTDVSVSTDEAMRGEVSRASTTATQPRRTSSKLNATPTVRERRVVQSNTEHLVVAPRKVRTVSVPAPPSAVASGSLTGSGRWLRVVGRILLGIVVVIWVLLLLGAIDNPDDLGAAIGGGAVTTLAPFLLGLVLLRAGKRRGIAV